MKIIVNINILSMLGLFFDIIGFAILFSLTYKDLFLKPLTIGSRNEGELFFIQNKRRYKKMWFGICFIFLGFTFQFFGSIYSFVF